MARILVAMVGARPRRAFFMRALPAGLLVVATACATNEQTGGLVGSGVGVAACGVIGQALFHSSLGTLLPAATCGAVGYFIGSAIGRQLDDKDRQRAAQATTQVLDAPVPRQPSRSRKATAPRPAPKPVTWASDHGTGSRGSATVTEVQPQASGGECRTVHEIAYIKGQEVAQDSRYCRGASGEWEAQA